MMICDIIVAVVIVVNSGVGDLQMLDMLGVGSGDARPWWCDSTW